jgi:hypothetical protein
MMDFVDSQFVVNVNEIVVDDIECEALDNVCGDDLLFEDILM